jgi:hypothetical protein
MQPSPEFSSNSVSSFARDAQKPVQAATIVYECVTIAAMLLLLCTMWVF